MLVIQGMVAEFWLELPVAVDFFIMLYILALFLVDNAL